MATMEKGDAAPVRILGRAASSRGCIIRDFLHRSDVPFEWIELTSDEDARTRAGVPHVRDDRLPVCIFPDGTRLALRRRRG